jgi:hypothetical protein
MVSIRISGAQRIKGFRFLWLKYVSGFDPSKHCARCLRGPFSARISPQMDLRYAISLDEYECDYLYLCGVSPRWETNLHIVFQPSAGDIIRVTTYNGLEIEIHGATQVPIPPLEQGFMGLPKEFTTCRNFQFGVAYYGFPGDVSHGSG